MTALLVAVVAVLAIALVVAIAFVAVGREVGRLEARVQPSVFELEEAVAYIAERLPAHVTARLSHADVRWILHADADALERVTAEEVADGDVDLVVDEVDAVARVLARATDERPDLADEDVVEVLEARTQYLRAIGAIGPEADDAG